MWNNYIYAVSDSKDDEITKKAVLSVKDALKNRDFALNALTEEMKRIRGRHSLIGVASGRLTPVTEFMSPVCTESGNWKKGLKGLRVIPRGDIFEGIFDREN